MELTSDKLTEAENKLIMMYIIHKTRRPISYKVYLELVTSLSDINYFDFHGLLQVLINDDYIEATQESRKIEQEIYNQTINEAKKINDSFLKKEDNNNSINFSNNLNNIKKDADEKEEQLDINEQEQKNRAEEKVTLYKLTEKGTEALRLALDVLPGITKLRVDSNFNKYYKIIREEYSVLAEYLPKQNLVVCKIVEHDKEIFRLEMHTQSISQAKNMIRNWKTKADEYYLKILKFLSQEPDTDLDDDVEKEEF